jgi:putative salt-induced outer membrane protein
MIHQLLRATAIIFSILGVSFAVAQSDISSEIELGAIITSGNTEDENIKFKGIIDWKRDRWEYGFSLEGFRSSKNNVLAAQRVYAVAKATYDLDEMSFIETRAAHEDDRFSGYDSQSDVTVSYGHTLLSDIEHLDWEYTIGAGARTSRSDTGDFQEAIIRAATELRWNISDNALFTQKLSIESGDQSSVSRSESSIQSDIMDNLSMKFSFKVKHQSEVPTGREKTDTETSVTLLLRL